MLYQVTGTLVNREPLSKPHEEFLAFLQETIRPSLAILEKFRQEGVLLAGGVRAGSQGLTFILDLAASDSHMGVRRLLLQLPLFSHFQFEVTPLESFQEWATIVGG